MVPSSALTAPDVERLQEQFHEAHARTYGYAAREDPVELVNMRLTARHDESLYASPPMGLRGASVPLGRYQIESHISAERQARWRRGVKPSSHARSASGCQALTSGAGYKRHCSLRRLGWLGSPPCGEYDNALFSSLSTGAGSLRFPTAVLGCTDRQPSRRELSRAPAHAKANCYTRSFLCRSNR
jgi:hypothetical protein